MLASLILLALAVAGASPPAQDPGTLQEAARLGPDQEPEATLDWEEATRDAEDWYGRVVTVTGRIVRTKNTGKVVFLNFAEDWRGTCTGVIFPSAWCDFAAPPEMLFLGKEVRITGRLKEYRGAPEIVVESPRQIACLDGTTVAANPALRPETPLPRGERPPGVRLVSWNLENFFDRHDDPYAEDESTQPAYVRHGRKQRIADALRRLDPDVVCLQEVENRGALQAFVAEYLPGMGYEVALVEGNDARGIDVAVLSRLPLGALTSHRHLRFPGAGGDAQRFRRDLLRVSVGPPLDADVYVVHLKSQQGGEAADAIREAEARAAAGILAAEMEADPGYRAVVAGDFNEVPEGETVRLFLRAGLVDPHAGSDRPSYHQEPYVSRIDYTLATPALAPDVAAARIVDDVEGVDLRCASDHYPVLLQLRATRTAPALTPPAPTEEEMHEDLDAAEKGLRASWSYLEDKSAHFGVDLDAVFAEAHADVPRVRDATDFRALLDRVVAGLRDGHAHVRWEVGVPRLRWPFTVWETQEGFVVVRAPRQEDGAAPEGWPRRGDLLLAAGGVAVERRVADVARRVSASTPLARRSMAVAGMHWPRLGPRSRHFRFRRPPDGEPWTVALPLEMNGPPALRGVATGGENWSLSFPRAGVALLRVSSFAVEEWQAWLEAGQEERDGLLAATRERVAALFRGIAEAGPSALILDLRGNGGGTDSLGIALARQLMPQRFTYFQLAAQRDGAWPEPHAYEHDPAEAAPVYAGPLIVLIDERCFSTTDNFLRALVTQRDDVTTIGRPTHGGTGAPRVVAELPHSGAAIVACTHRVYDAEGRVTEGRGTAPDVPVAWTAADAVDGGDPDLRAALALLDAR